MECELVLVKSIDILSNIFQKEKTKPDDRTAAERKYDIIMGELERVYKNKTYNGVMILDILSLTRISELRISKNYLDCRISCDVEFVISGYQVNIYDIIMCKLERKMSTGSIFSFKYGNVHVESTKSPIISLLKEGDYVPISIADVNTSRSLNSLNAFGEVLIPKKNPDIVIKLISILDINKVKILQDRLKEVYSRIHNLDKMDSTLFKKRADLFNKSTEKSKLIKHGNIIDCTEYDFQSYKESDLVGFTDMGSNKCGFILIKKYDKPTITMNVNNVFISYMKQKINFLVYLLDSLEHKGDSKYWKYLAKK